MYGDNLFIIIIIYLVSLSTESYVNWCWSKKEFEVDIPTSGTHPPILFSQTGFLLEIESSHDTDVVRIWLSCAL